MQSTLTKTKGIGCRFSILAFFLGTTLGLAACGEKPQQPPAPETPPVKLFQTEREALDKAKAVGQAADKAAEDMKQQADQPSN